MISVQNTIKKGNMIEMKLVRCILLVLFSIK